MRKRSTKWTDIHCGGCWGNMEYPRSSSPWFATPTIAWPTKLPMLVRGPIILMSWQYSTRMLTVTIPLPLVIDYIMRTAASGRKNGIFSLFGQSWCKSIISTLPMIWLSFRITKDKCRTKTASTGAGFKIKVDNRKWKITTTSQTPVANVDEPIKVEPFIYPGSMVGTQSGQDRDIKPKIGKASAAFTMLKNIWASRFG